MSIENTVHEPNIADIQAEAITDKAQELTALQEGLKPSPKKLKKLILKKMEEVTVLLEGGDKNIDGMLEKSAEIKALKNTLKSAKKGYTLSLEISTSETQDRYDAALYIMHLYQDVNTLYANMTDMMQANPFTLDMAQAQSDLDEYGAKLRMVQKQLKKKAAVLAKPKADLGYPENEVSPLNITDPYLDRLKQQAQDMPNSVDLTEYKMTDPYIVMEMDLKITSMEFIETNIITNIKAAEKAQEQYLEFEENATEVTEATLILLEENVDQMKKYMEENPFSENEEDRATNLDQMKKLKEMQATYKQSLSVLANQGKKLNTLLRNIAKIDPQHPLIQTAKKQAMEIKIRSKKIDRKRNILMEAYYAPIHPSRQQKAPQVPRAQ